MRRANVYINNFNQQKKELEEIEKTPARFSSQEEKVTTESKVEAPESVPPTEKPQEITKKEVKKSAEPNKERDHLKQVNFTIGEEREMKVEDLAHQYSRKKKRRVNRNDVVRFLIDNVTFDELLKYDLTKYKK